MKPYIIVANWKMYFSYQEATAWSTAHFSALSHVVSNSSVSLVICPSYEALSSIAQITHNSPILFGAQDCSPFENGAYTGQVSARSLKEIGCSYAIIGHSEVRKYPGESDTTIALKLAQLFKNSITPIICIDAVGQLEPLLPTLAQHQSEAVCIAYEPLSAIGSHAMPQSQHLSDVYKTLAKTCAANNLKNIKFLYGGNVNENTLPTIKNIPEIRGVLVGRASTDFQKIKTIVSLVQKDYPNTP